MVRRKYEAWWVFAEFGWTARLTLLCSGCWEIESLHPTTLICLGFASEGIAQGKLNLAGRGVAVSIRGSNLTKGVRIEDPVGQIEIAVVEQVEEIDAELQTMPFTSYSDFL